MDRQTELDKVRARRRPWDIVIIGGGATGIGAALDAASRGLGVLLLEQSDFGKGTSSRSTKLIHGGVRYLRHGDVRLVREALGERTTLLQNAPHAVRMREFVIPCYGRGRVAAYGLGLKLYDALASTGPEFRSRLLSRDETLSRLPSIRQDRLSGGVLYYDGQFDEMRLLFDIAATAVEFGACLINYARVEGFESSNGRISAVRFEDAETGEHLTVATKSVINATGIFSDIVRDMSDTQAAPQLTFAQGSHVVLSPKFLPSESAMMIPKTADGRVLFCIPWRERVLAGTTDTRVAGPRPDPSPSESEIDLILATLADHLCETPTRKDILSMFAGIRPLVHTGRTRRTSAISRGHTVFTDSNGLVTVTGGKWTTYRRMAEDAVDRAAVVGAFAAGKCATRKLALVDSRISDDTDPLLPGIRLTRGEVTEAVRCKMARCVEDVLARRSQILFTDARAAVEVAPKVSAILAEELGRDDAWSAAEVDQFTRLARRHLPDVESFS